MPRIACRDAVQFARPEDERQGIFVPPQQRRATGIFFPSQQRRAGTRYPLGATVIEGGGNVLQTECGGKVLNGILLIANALRKNV